MIPVRVVERLIAYRRRLRAWFADGKARIYSHELANLEGVTPAVVRRDLMTIGYTGSPARGYDVAGLIEKVGQVLDPPAPEGIALVGVGSLGRAILNYFSGAHPELPIVAAFDVDLGKVGRIINGCPCHSINDIEAVLRAGSLRTAILAVPADAAQHVAERLTRAGARGLLNFTPVRLRVPPEVYVEDVDIAVLLEKVVYFARSEDRRLEAQT